MSRMRDKKIDKVGDIHLSSTWCGEVAERLMALAF